MNTISQKTKSILAMAFLGATTTLSAPSFAQGFPGVAAQGPSKTFRSLAGAPASPALPQAMLLALLAQMVQQMHVDAGLSDLQVVEGSLKGLLQNLDPHSAYLTKDELKEMKTRTQGQFGGLGIEIEKDKDKDVIKIVTPMDDTPAARAGVKPGDLIIKINDQPTMGMSVNDAAKIMRGKSGDRVKLTIYRNGEDQPLEFTLIREIIKTSAVKARPLGNDIGYIRMSSFDEHLDEDVAKAVKKLRKDMGREPSGYVLDLRNNPGGLLDQAISVSDAFLKKGEIVSSRNRNPSENRRDVATPGDITNGKPLVVLINGGSASASEIFAGALQSNGRAIVMGTQSFGKGSIQSILPIQYLIDPKTAAMFPLANKMGALKITTGLYFTPNGVSIQDIGITPDILVDAPNGDAGIREADLKGTLANPNGVKTAPQTPKETCSPTQKDLSSVGLDQAFVRKAPGQPDFVDVALLCAVEKLRGQATHIKIAPYAPPARPAAPAPH